MTPVRALCLDLDDTLLDGGGYLRAIGLACDEIAAGQHGFTSAQLQEANSVAFLEYWPEVEAGWTLGKIETASLSVEIWRRALRACGCDDQALAVALWDAHWRYTRETFRLFDDAAALLESVRSRLPLALITNGASDLQREKLRRLDLERHFERVLISGEVGIAKPDRAIFGLAAEALGVELESVWHVGDSLPLDVPGAQSAGLTAVWLNRNGDVWKDGDPKPDYEIHSLNELDALIARASKVSSNGPL